MSIPFKLTCKPKEHQKRAVQFTLNHPNSIIASATGSGKTLMSIMVAMLFLAQGKVDKSLIIVTKKSKLSYEKDLQNLTDIDINKQVQVIYEAEDTWDFYKDSDKVLGIVQYENFKSIDIIHWEDLFKKHRVLVQLDEYHKAKSAMTELFIPKNSADNKLMEKPTKSYTKLNEYLYRLRPLITNIIGWTATPLSKNTDDLFWLSTLTQPGIFNDSLLDFYNTYIRYSAFLIPLRKGSPIKRTNIKTYGYKNTNILVEKLNTICFNYFPKEDIKFIQRYYEPAEAIADYKKAVQGILETYNEMKINDDTGEKENKDFSARLLDAQYVLNNCYNKKDLLLHVLKETVPNGVLIYCNYYNTVEVLDYVLTSALIPYREISGRTTDKQCKEYMDWFNSEPDGKVVLLTGAGAQSINLQSTNNFIFYELPYTASGVQQAIGRMIRIGSKYNSFNVYNLIAKNTVEEYKYEYLASNEEMIRYVQGNPNYFPSGELKSFNTEILRKMRKEMLWDKA